MMMHMAKTTVTIRDDLYNILRKEAGKRGVSEMINQILAEHLLKERLRTDLFGTMRKVDLGDLRDHAERCSSPNLDSREKHRSKQANM